MCFAQKNSQNYEGAWVGHLPDRTSFNLEVSLKKMDPTTYHLTIANDEPLIDQRVSSSTEKGIRVTVDQQLFFDLTFAKDGQSLTGFIKTGRFIFHVDLPKTGDDQFTGSWNPFMFDDGLQSDDFLLYVEPVGEDLLAAYPIFGDQRFRGTWASGFKKNGNSLLFRDSNTGFHFRAKLMEISIDLEIYLVDAMITRLNLTSTDEDWTYKSDPVDQARDTDRPAELGDDWSTASIREYGINQQELLRLLDSIQAEKLVNTHSVLIAKDHKLVFEKYFQGFNARIPHDLRSASKSISSAMIGIAIADNLLEGVEEPLFNCLPQEYQYVKDQQKAQIKLHDLLTMTSGLDVNDRAAENTYQDSRNPNSWLQTVLEAPMVHTPGTYADYGSANPFLLGVCLNERLNEPLEQYMHRKLFAPLGINNYINQTDDTEVTPYFGGGMLLTPRDLLKFGQLYLNKGKWQGRQIIAEDWVKASFTKHVQLQDVRNKNWYGYQWWHDTYEVNGRLIRTTEARGAGGQFIFIIPELDSVVVITSGNFRNGKGNQARDILQKYILPAMVD
jgi:CubicO group peptidase (beta-lactamase class C family)